MLSVSNVTLRYSIYQT